MEQDQGQSLPPGISSAQYAAPDMQAQPMPVQEGPFALGLAADAGRASNIAWTTIPPMHPLSGPLVQMFKVRWPSHGSTGCPASAIVRSPEPGAVGSCPSLARVATLGAYGTWRCSDMTLPVFSVGGDALNLPDHPRYLLGTADLISLGIRICTVFTHTMTMVTT